jgi:SAM-dependent methyltransferase
MSHDPKAPQGMEVRKTRWRAMPYLRGKVLDLGCGPEKVIDTKECIGVDSCKDTAMFGIAINPDVKADIKVLGLFAAGAVDAVFSSHALEHFYYREVPGILREWMRVLKIGGYLVLYLPDEDQYPKCAEPERGIYVSENHCNLDHKWNVNLERVVAAMEAAGNWDLVHYEKCADDDEYSLFFAFKKLK